MALGGGHEAAAKGDELEAFLQGIDASDGDADIFADAVAENGGRFDAPAFPELGEGPFDGEESHLSVGRLVDFLLVASPQNVGQVSSLTFQQLSAFVDGLLEYGLGVIELFAHAVKLRALTGE